MLFTKTQNGFTALYRSHAGAIQRLINGMVKNKTIAEELTQESFLKAWKSLPQFGFRSSLKTWVYSVAINTTTDWLRSHRHTLTWNESPAEVIELESVEAQSIRKSLAMISEEPRVLLMLHYYDDLSLQEISVILKIPVGTVKSRLFNAKSELKKILLKQGFDV